MWKHYSRSSRKEVEMRTPKNEEVQYISIGDPLLVTLPPQSLEWHMCAQSNRGYASVHSLDTRGPRLLPS